jgi:hypothetical protein
MPVKLSQNYPQPEYEIIEVTDRADQPVYPEHARLVINESRRCGAFPMVRSKLAHRSRTSILTRQRRK